MILDVARALVALNPAKGSSFGVVVLVERFLVGCLCWLVLLSIGRLLPLNIGEVDLCDVVLLVVRGCYETSCDTLLQPLKLACIVVVAVVHNTVAAVHHSVVGCVLCLWAS